MTTATRAYRVTDDSTVGGAGSIHPKNQTTAFDASAGQSDGRDRHPRSRLHNRCRTPQHQAPSSVRTRPASTPRTREVERDGRPGVEFSWEGNDEGDAASGRAWATLSDDDALSGRIFFHMGDDSSFNAVRDGSD